MNTIDERRSFRLGPIPLALLALLSLLGVPGAGLAAGSPPAKSIPGWHQNLDEALAEAKKRDTLILVDLYAEWCGWCKVLEDRVFTTPDFQRYAEKFVKLRVDTEDGAEGSALNSRFSVESLPMLLILDASKVKVGQVAGYLPTPDFIGAIDTQLQAWQMLTRHYDQVVAEGDAEMVDELAREFHRRGDGHRAAGLYEKRLKEKDLPAAELARLQFLLADAYRLERRFPDAKRLNGQAATAVSGLAEEKNLAEKIDLLHFYIAQDNGDCKGAVSSLERFLVAHPTSEIQTQLRKTLQELKTEPACT